MKLSKLILTLFYFSVQSLLAQNYGVIKGKVFIEDLPALGANIFLEENKEFNTITDTEGNFQISDIPYGTYTLKCSYVGASVVSKKVVVSKDISSLNIELKFDNQLEEIVISGTLKPVSRLDSPVPVEVYSSSFLKKNPTSNIFEALQNVNGVRPQNNCGVCNTGEIKINGLEGAYTFVLIDGMPIVSGLSTVYGLSGIPNSLIERIEIVKGPASSLYGSEAVAGLINVITKKSSSAPKLSLDGFATSWGEFNLDASSKFSVGKTSSLLGVNYFNYNQRIDNNNDGFTDLALQDRISVFNKWNFYRKSNKTFSLVGRYYYEDRFGGQLGWTTSDRGGDQVYGESIYTSRAEVFGAYQFNSSENINLTFSANTHDQNSFYGDTSYNADQSTVFTQTTWDKKIGNHDILLGSALKYTYYNDNTTATLSADKAIIPSVFVQDQWEVSNKSDLLLGIRYDYDNRHGNILTPRIAYKLGLTKNDVLRFNLGTGFRVVNLFTEDHAALSGSREVIINENLNPEQSYNGNINYLMKRYLKSGTFFTLEASSWYTYFTNKIFPDYDTNPDQIIYSNLNGHAISTGVSLQTDINFSNGVKVSLGTSLQNVTNTEDGETTDQILTEKFNANASISYKIQSLNLNIDYTSNFYGPMRLPTVEFVAEDGTFVDDPRQKESPFWGTHNLQLTYNGWGKIELYGGVKNILNWTPAKDNQFVISRANDPFERDTNPYALAFDPSYIYTSMQGIRGFLGVRYNLF